MKPILSMLLCATLLFGCKKDKSQPTPQPLNIEVSGLTDKTSLTLIIRKSGVEVFRIVNQFGNKTYTTTPLTTGDRLDVHYSCNIKSDLENNGNGTIKFSYNSKSVGAVGGNLNYTTGGNTTIVIP